MRLNRPQNRGKSGGKFGLAVRSFGQLSMNITQICVSRDFRKCQIFPPKSNKPSVDLRSLSHTTSIGRSVGQTMKHKKFSGMKRIRKIIRKLKTIITLKITFKFKNNKKLNKPKLFITLNLSAASCMYS